MNVGIFRYIVNYFPFDIFYKLNRFMPIRLIVCVLKEIQRTKKIYLGVKMASRKHPENVLLWLTIGMIKGKISILNIFTNFKVPPHNYYFFESYSVLTYALLKLPYIE